MAKSNYITRQGWLALDQELKFCGKKNALKLPKRFQMPPHLVTAVKTQNIFTVNVVLREIDRRVRFLSKRLEVLQIVDTTETRRQSVFRCLGLS